MVSAFDPRPREAALRDVLAALDRDGITGLPGLLGRAWASALAEDFARLFDRALTLPNGTIARGPERHYFSIHAEALRGFVALATCPTLDAIFEAVLGPRWALVELGFDVPRPGSKYQPWHRDFPMPAKSAAEHVLTSLAVNATTVDVTPELGPLVIAPGTQWDDGRGWAEEMFPPRDVWPRYEARAELRLPRLGDVSVRTGLTVHRGTPNTSTRDRGILILGAVSPDDPTPEHHVLAMTRTFHARLPAELRAHLRADVVDRLPEHPVQRHEIEGLRAGVDRYRDAADP